MNKHPLKEKADSMAAKLSMITKELSFMPPPKNSFDDLAEDQQLMMIMEDEINSSQKEKSTLLLQIRKTKIEIKEIQKNIKNINQTCQENKPSLMSDQDALIDKLLSINDQSLLISVGTSSQVESRQHENNTTDNNDNCSLRAKNIERLISFTKINFLKVCNNLITTDGNRIRYYNHTGNSYGINFRIEFEVNETNLAIRKLKVKLDSGVKREIGKFIENVEKDRNLLIFFRGFIEYARLNHQRKLLFDILRRKYPTLTLPSFHNPFTQDFSCLCVDVHSSLRFSDNRFDKIGPELILSWNLNITSSGHILSDVKMHARMPHQWKLLDERHVIDRISFNFQNLVKIQGIQLAIETIVKSLFKVSR